MTEQRAILDGAARIHGDTSDSRIEKLLPDPRSNIEAWGLPDGRGGATGQVAFDIGLHRGGHLVLTPTRRRSHEGPDTAQFGALLHHGVENPGDDADTCPDSAGVHGSDDSRILVGQQQRYAICRQHDQPQVPCGGHHRVGDGDRIRLRAVHHGHRPAMDLFHPHQTVGAETELTTQSGTVGSDRRRFVSDVVAEIETVERRGRHTPRAGGGDPTNPE